MKDSCENREMSCSEVQGHLSDLLDVRRGERPNPEGTPLGDMPLRAAVERHLEACETCRETLSDLEDIGAAFSEFAVGEKAAQDFADFGEVVRQRMRAEHVGSSSVAVERSRPRPEAGQHRGWWITAMASAAAMLLLSVLFSFPPQNQDSGVAKDDLKEKKKEDSTTADLGAPRGEEVDRAENTKVAARSDSILPVAEGVLETTPLVHPEPVPLGRLRHLDMDFAADGQVPFRMIAPSGMARSMKVSSGYISTMQEMENFRGNFDRLLVEEEQTGDDKDGPLIGFQVSVFPRAHFREGMHKGILVNSVTPHGPAAQAGLSKGDMIMALRLTDGREIETFEYSTHEEVLVMLSILNSKVLGRGKTIIIDFDRQDSDGLWIMKSGRATLGKYK